MSSKKQIHLEDKNLGTHSQARPAIEHGGHAQPAADTTYGSLRTYALSYLQSTIGNQATGNMLHTVHPSYKSIQRKNETSLFSAIEKGELEIVRHAADQNNINSTNDAWDTPLIAAVKKEKKQVVEILLSVPGIDINKTDVKFMTPLHLAVKSQNLGIVWVLLKTRADVHARTAKWETPLHLATQLNNMTLRNMLLSQGADPSAEDSQFRKAGTETQKKNGELGFNPDPMPFSAPIDIEPVKTNGKQPEDLYAQYKKANLVRIQAEKWWHSPNFKTGPSSQLKIMVKGTLWAIVHVKFNSWTGPSENNVLMQTFKAPDNSPIANGNIWRGSAYNEFLELTLLYKDSALKNTTENNIPMKK